MSALVTAAEAQALLDRAVRDACERRYVPTAEHRACAARIVAEVLA